MARINTKATSLLRTHEGAPAKHLTPELQLRRSVLSCMLWEDEFYEDGKSIADRISDTVAQCNLSAVARLAHEARTEGNLRHVPLLLLIALAKAKYDRLEELVTNVIQRPDEITELVAIYWKDGKKPLPAAFKRGLAATFDKFGEYSLAKYNRDSKVRLRDVMRLVHPKPSTPEKADLYKRLLAGELKTPDTWEVALSGGADKKATFERLIREGNLGYFALLRNLRNMEQAGVNRDLVNEAILARKNGADRLLPFRFVAAARAAPYYEPSLDKAMIANIKSLPPLEGSTTVLVDVSGSMGAHISAKSDLTRMDAACALASLIDGDVDVYSFSNSIKQVPHRLGMAGVDAIRSSQHHGGTDLGGALRYLSGRSAGRRLIVITDEQSYTQVSRPKNFVLAYMINVASNRNGVGYGDWIHIDGFSESVIKYISALETDGSST